MQQNNTMDPRYKKPFDDYFNTKDSSDVDLTQIVRNVLNENGMSSELEKFDNHRFVKDSVNKSSDVQRHLLNRYWTEQLINSRIPCQEVRYALLPNGGIEQWVDMFVSEVVPFFTQNNITLTA